MKKPKAPRLVTVAITTTITVIFWIFFTLYQILTSKPDPSVDPILLDPINPNLDTNALESAGRRSFFEESAAFAPSENTPTPVIVEEIPQEETETSEEESQEPIEPEQPTP